MEAKIEELVQLMEHQRPALMRVALRRSRSREDAEDAVQEGFLNAYRHLDQFDGRAQLSSWLTRIVVNAATDRMRRHLAHPTVGIEDQSENHENPTLVDPQPGPEDLRDQQERVGMLQWLMEGLPAAWRGAVTLRAIEGLSTREAAQRLGVAEGTVKSHLFRAHRYMRRQAEMQFGA
ncbi:MAG TPA: sigma-70 family RNA polymerase sigma factor [Terriglobales bacterium]|nr:sigma-70 family RNA polymerase sigma factor [Terriglobales bacterium]